MQDKLIPIYAIRMMFLEKLNPRFFAANYELIRRTSLAAQDYVMSGDYQEYNLNMGRMFKLLPGYIAVHKKYNLPYNPTLAMSGPVNSGLVMDLAWSLHQDIVGSVVTDTGDVTDVSKLPQSEVLRVYHNSSIHGTPVGALYTLLPWQVDKILNTARAQSR